MIPLAIGTLLAIGAMAFVLVPLFRASVEDVPAARKAVLAQTAAHERRDGAIAALREIEFDRATGKLTDDDYVALKGRYTEQALLAMRAEGDAPAIDADVEAVIRQVRQQQLALSCPDDGPRPEPDAAYCSDCGRYLAGECVHCGSRVDTAGARFCESCGHRLAA